MEIRVSPESLRTCIRNTLLECGVPDTLAAVEAEVMAEADWMGVPSHGIRMLPLLVNALRQGRANPNPAIALPVDFQAVCVMDGDNGPGRCLSVQAMQQAVGRAKQFGIGACLARRVTHWGRAHAYAYRAARAGCVGLCTTNAIPNMLAWNSRKPLLGNNPLAIAVPRGASLEPIILDMAMSQAAVGKIGTAVREGKAVPENWGLDAEGKPTRDPALILSSRKLLSFGDHKGVGLAVMMELLTGALSGECFSHEIAARDSSGLDPNSSKLFIALAADRFLSGERLEERIRDYLNYLSLAEPDLCVSLPGDRGWQARDLYSREGIPIHRDIVEQLKTIKVDLEEFSG